MEGRNDERPKGWRGMKGSGMGDETRRVEMGMNEG